MQTKKLYTKIMSIVLVVAFISLFIYLVVDLLSPLKELLFNGNDAPLKDTLEGYGILKYIFMVMLSAFQIFSTIMPGEPIQILSAITCGAAYGFLVCLVGIIIGNIIMYISVKLFNVEIKDKKHNQEELSLYIDKNEKQDVKSLTWFIIGLYLAPLIPDGVIAYTAVKNKMGFIRYLIVTTLGVIPQIVITITGSTIILKHSHNIFKISELLPVLIVGLVIFLAVYLTIKHKKSIINHIMNRSIRATIIWLIPLLILCIVDAYLLIKHKYLTCGIMFLVIIGYVLCYMIFDPKVAKYFTKKKMNDFKNDIVLNQNNFLWWFMYFILKTLFHRKVNLKVDKNNIEKFENPSIIVFNHCSAIDFINILPNVYPQKVNVVAAYYYFCNYHLGRLLNKYGVFPKFLYQPDISALKNMHKVIRNGNILFLSPEGRLSAYGEMESYIPSTVKFLKKEKCDVYIAKSYGAYFTKPKWAKNYRKGRVDLKFEKIFTKEQLETLSIEQIYFILHEKLYYNEYDWMEKEKVAFKGRKFAEGLEHILYICPVCKKEYTYKSKGNTMTCSHCKTKVKLNKYYQFESENYQIPKNIRDWYVFQKDLELQNIQDPNYKLQTNVTLKLPDPKGNGFSVVGKGVCTLTHQGINYKGTISGEDKDILFPLDTMPALPFGVREDFEIYHDQTLYYFIPDNIRKCVKFSVVEEQMYELYRKNNNFNPWD